MLIARERSRISQPEIRQRSQATALSCSIDIYDYKVKSNAVLNCSHCLLNLIDFAKYNLCLSFIPCISPF